MRFAIYTATESNKADLAEDVVTKCVDDHRRPWQITWVVAVVISMLVGLVVPNLADVPNFRFFPLCFVSTYTILTAFGVAPFFLCEPAHYQYYASGQLLRQMELNLLPNDLDQWNQYFKTETKKGVPITVQQLNAFAHKCRRERIERYAILDQRGYYESE